MCVSRKVSSLWPKYSGLPLTWPPRSDGRSRRDRAALPRVDPGDLECPALTEAACAIEVAAAARVTGREGRGLPAPAACSHRCSLDTWLASDGCRIFSPSKRYFLTKKKKYVQQHRHRFTQYSAHNQPRISTEEGKLLLIRAKITRQYIWAPNLDAYRKEKTHLRSQRYQNQGEAEANYTKEKSKSTCYREKRRRPLSFCDLAREKLQPNSPLSPDVFFKD